MESNKKKKRRERRAEVYNLSVVIAFIAFCCSMVTGLLGLLDVSIYCIIVFGIAGFIAIFFHDNPEGWEDVHWPPGAA